MQNETDGQKVMRMFGSIVRKYVQMFYEAEVDWFDNCIANINPKHDLFYVATLPSHKMRTFFWLDKFSYFHRNGLLSFCFIVLQKQYFMHRCWRLPPFFLCDYEEELMYVLLLYMRKHDLGYLAPFLFEKLNNTFDSFILEP